MLIPGIEFGDALKCGVRIVAVEPPQRLFKSFSRNCDPCCGIRKFGHCVHSGDNK